MVRILILACVAAVIGLAVYGVVTVYDETLQIGRMWETPAERPHEAPLGVMPAGTVPFEGGEALWRTADPDSLTAPMALADPDVIARGAQAYQFYCVHCHGRHHDGNGTVGQSFAPLPGDLRSVRVQALPPGRVFHEISYGLPGGRQPPLAATMRVDERWQVIGYMYSLGTRP